MKISLDQKAIMPERAHAEDAGLDLFAPEDSVIPAGGCCIIDTGVHVEIPGGYVGMLKSKSGLNVKHDIVSEGVIDCGYTGSIVAKLYNHGKYDYEIYRGDKITQLVIMPCIIPTLELVDKLTETERGSGGFGSTGR